MKLEAIEELTEALHLLPGIGRRTAERMAYQILEMDEFNANRILDAIKSVKRNIDVCPICGAYMEKSHCPFCNDELTLIESGNKLPSELAKQCRSSSLVYFLN